MENEELRPRRLSIDPDLGSQRYPIEKMTGALQRRPRDSAMEQRSSRVPPQAVDVERAVLGAMLIGREAIPRAIERLPPDAVYDNANQRIYSSILACFHRRTPVDLLMSPDDRRSHG